MPSEYMPSQYVVHFAITEFYDVPVEAESADEAFDLASEILGPEHLDTKSGADISLADWTKNPIELIEGKQERTV